MALDWRATAVPRWMIVGEWRAHPVRIVTAVVAIAIGVALGFAVHLINASALDRFARGLATVNGGADLRIAATGVQGFDERVYPRVARLAGIAAASPVVVLHARLDGRPLDLLGLDVLRAAAVTPLLLARPERERGLALFDPDALFLSRAALAGHHVGDHVALVVAGRVERFAIAGLLPGVDGRALAVIDIAAAQDRFDRLGRLDRIDLKLAAGADARRVRATLAATLPADAAAASTADDASRTDALSRAYRVNLDMLALVALLTGAFLVYSAQALSIARRRAHFALLRVLGASRAMVMGQILAEGLALGVVGAAIGIVAGLGLAAGVLRLVGGDLGSGYFAGQSAPPLLFAPGAALGFAGLGLAAATLGSLLPARSAARVTPAVALKALGDAVDPRRRPPILPALLLALAGGACALMPAVGGIALFGYGAVGLLLAAGIAAMPWLARTLLAPLARRHFAAPVVELAVDRLWGAPSQAAVALSGIVASVGLMIAMAVMVASFRGSVDAWLDQILVADLYVSANGDTPFDPALQARLSRLLGVGAITFGAQHPIVLAPNRPALTLIVRADPDHADPPLGRVVPPPAGALAVRVSEPAVRLYALAPGATLTLPLGARRVPAFVTAIYRDYARQDGAVMIAGHDYDRLTGDTARGEAAITLAPGADLVAIQEALHRALPAALADEVQIVPTRLLKARALAIFDRSFAITFGLELVAIVVGLAGVAATASAQTIARTREFGMLRHLGVTRRQIVAMLGIEGALLGLVGGVAGVALGCGLAQILIHVVNPQSFNWTMDTRLPLGLLAGVALALIVASAATAMLAGRRAVSADAVRAVREDW
ncbi:FtsX-like permease family protein [Sphingomonas nostoxanthinifaciens]|uniref:FtsX-like permease family protein n=1 Tax=Sphingomonas nostoxanthinifaciens TaxID=2872652 RepID=UPI001CC1E1A3|nr:FtsX-like permease family protein [Sphingomonas nostoxanthinifaciens]UAK26661.1 FtsX-like permease family protein [Sphingomonas nostoxanthinifaciens]